MTIDDDVLSAARRIAGGNLSALVNDALAARVRRERLVSFAAEAVQDAHPTDGDRGHVAAQWPS